FQQNMPSFEELSLDPLACKILGFMQIVSETQAVTKGCGVCGHKSAELLYSATDRLSASAEPFSIARCEGCAVWRTLPEMTDRELAKFYGNDYWGGEDDPPKRWIETSQAEKTRFIEKTGAKGGRILDIGCGSGLFLRALDENIWNRQGVETGELACQA